MYCDHDFWPDRGLFLLKVGLPSPWECQVCRKQNYFPSLRTAEALLLADSLSVDQVSALAPSAHSPLANDCFTDDHST